MQCDDTWGFAFTPQHRAAGFDWEKDHWDFRALPPLTAFSSTGDGTSATVEPGARPFRRWDETQEPIEGSSRLLMLLFPKLTALKALLNAEEVDSCSGPERSEKKEELSMQRERERERSSAALVDSQFPWHWEIGIEKILCVFSFENRNRRNSSILFLIFIFIIL